MPDAYPTLTHSPTITGTLIMIPNSIKSEFLGGFIAQSQNGRKSVIKIFDIVQPLDSLTEFATMETFIEDHAASTFTIKYLDKDPTGATTLTVVFDGNISYSTDGGRSELVIPVKEAQ